MQCAEKRLTMKFIRFGKIFIYIFRQDYEEYILDMNIIEQKHRLNLT